MIVTVTLNPMLDKTITVSSIALGHIHRAETVVGVAGGKGINVARQLKHLGHDCIATGFLGGEVGQIVAGLLSEEGIRHDFVMTDSQTREGLTFLEPDGTATSVFEPTPSIDGKFLQLLVQKVASLMSESHWIALCGSSPSLETERVCGEVIARAHQLGTRSVLDSYGETLRFGIAAKPNIVKINKDEYETTFRVSLKSEADILRALDSLLSHGIQHCVMTNGSQPAYAASQAQRWKLVSPSIEAVNPVGSGDAMLAGILYGFEESWDFEECLAFGIAAGVANAKQWSVARSSLEAILAIKPSVEVHRLK